MNESVLLVDYENIGKIDLAGFRIVAEFLYRQSLILRISSQHFAIFRMH